MYLETARLVIRDWRAEDLADAQEIFSDPEVMALCEPPYSPERTAEALEYFAASGIAFAVELKDEGKVIGHALFKQLPGEAEGVYEIGWIYNRRCWRRGYALEAASALVDYGFSELGLHKICAETIDARRSVPLMERLGMRREGVLRRHALAPDGSWADVYWYGLLAGERP